MQEVEFFCIWRNKVIDETEMFGKNACVVVLCNFIGDNKLLRVNLSLYVTDEIMQL